MQKALENRSSGALFYGVIVVDALYIVEKLRSFSRERDHFVTGFMFPALRFKKPECTEEALSHKFVVCLKYQEYSLAVALSYPFLVPIPLAAV